MIHFETLVTWVFPGVGNDLSESGSSVSLLPAPTNPVGIELFSYGNAFFCSP